MYIQLDVNYFGHPKAAKLRAIVGPEADVYPLRIWAWAAKYAPSGVLASKVDVEIAAVWLGKPGALVAALRKVGLIEADGRTLHDWMERTGRDLEVYARKKERLREKYRKESSGILPGRLPEPSAVSDLNGSERNGTITQRPKPAADAGSLAAFEYFWKAYPKKESRKDADRAWRKLSPDPVLAATIAADIAWRKSNQWHDRQFIPHPATYLNGRRWEDERAVPSGRVPTVEQSKPIERVDPKLQAEVRMKMKSLADRLAAQLPVKMV